MKYSVIWKIVLTVLLGAFACGAEELGDSVAIVYNSDAPHSREIAEYYASVRHVPSNQIFGIQIYNLEQINRKTYHDYIETPLLHKLEEQKLLVFEPAPTSTNKDMRRLVSAKIRYLVMCYGMPLRIGEQGDLREKGTENWRSELRRNTASVDSELSLMAWADPHRLLSGAFVNPCYGATNPASINPANGVLIVARLDGPTADIARSLIDKAQTAERDGLWGRAYFDLRDAAKGSGYEKGDNWLKTAAKASASYGFDTVVDEKAATFSAGFPLSHIALYAGWYDSSVSGPFTQPQVEFMPGAFAYHLHSYSAGTLHSATNNWCGPLLAKGATVTMGCVDEPYLDGTPDIAVFLTRWLAGFTFGEAACASQEVLSWQATVVGDPLYRPFGKNPQKLHEFLTAEHSPMLDWSFIRVVNLSLNHGVTPGKLVEYIKEANPSLSSPILCEKLGDLYQLSGANDMAIQMWEHARMMEPSPMQNIRLVQKTGDSLLATGQDEKALALWDSFLVGNLNYPDALGLYNKLEPLAKKLRKKEQADRYKKEIARLTASKSQKSQ